MNEKKLNVASGKDIREGWTNLDKFKGLGADIIFDLNKIFEGEKMPFKDNEFDYILCSHLLEDFSEFMPIVDEMIRVCKPGGRIEIRVPFETATWMGNPYHKRPFTLNTFYSIPNKENYNEVRPIKIEVLKYYTLKGRYKILNIIKFFVEKSYNLVPFQLIEGSFLKYMFPQINCKVIYRKTK